MVVLFAVLLIVDFFFAFGFVLSSGFGAAGFGEAGFLFGGDELCFGLLWRRPGRRRWWRAGGRRGWCRCGW